MRGNRSISHDRELFCRELKSICRAACKDSNKELILRDYENDCLKKWTVSSTVYAFYSSFDFLAIDCGIPNMILKGGGEKEGKPALSSTSADCVAPWLDLAAPWGAAVHWQSKVCDYIGSSCMKHNALTFTFYWCSRVNGYC